MYRAQQQYLPAALVVAGTGNNTFISCLSQTVGLSMLMMVFLRAKCNALLVDDDDDDDDDNGSSHNRSNALPL